MKRMNVLLGGMVGALLVLSAHLQVTRSQEPLQLTMDANSVRIRAGESPILRYRYASYGGSSQFKPYVKELYSPGGLNVLLDAPPDHLHHHGLMFAVAADGVNFWEETPGAGQQIHRDFSSVQFTGYSESPVSRFPGIHFAEEVYWKSPAKLPPGWVLSEHREIEVFRRSTPGTGTLATVLTWTSKLGVPDAKQPVSLTGSHYFGLGMRFPRSMDGTGEFLNADGKEGTIFRGEERLVRSNWCAYQATAEGKPVMVVMFGDPGNPRSPTTWFTMAKPFAYMSATPGLHEQPLEVPARQPLRFRYGVVIWDRHVLPVQIDAFYREWALVDWKLAQPTSQTDESK